MSRYECVGQMNIFDLLSSPEPATSLDDSSILIPNDSVIYRVRKGNVDILRYLNDTYTFTRKDDDGVERVCRGYRLKSPSTGCFDSFTNEKFDKSYFLSDTKALKVACDYIAANKNNIILVEDMNPVKTIAYTYIRKCDSRQMIAFFSILDNGMAYVKDFYTYHHCYTPKNIDKELKQFTERSLKSEANVKELPDYVPPYTNMYKCKEQDNHWEYAECSYSGCL